MADHKTPAAHKLLSSCAIGLALVAIARAPQAEAQSYQGTVTSSLGANVSTAPGQTIVDVTQARAIINWAPTDTAAGATPIIFQPAASTAGDGAYFNSLSDFTILNRIVPTGAATGRAIQFNGSTVGMVGSSVPVTGGNIWFYSPGGIVMGSSASFDVGSLLLSTLDVTDADFLDGGPYQFAAPANSTSEISIQSGAQINAATNEGSYVAMIAPRVVQSGTVNVNGSTAYVAAEEAIIDIASGLFSIDITRGTTDPNGIVHSGSTTGPASTGGADAHNIYLVAVPKNDAITMLVGGSLGYQAAGAGIVNGGVQLYAGYDLPGGISTREGGANSDIIITNAFLRSDLTARAARNAEIRSIGSGGFQSLSNVTLLADSSATITTAANTFTSISGDLALIAGSGAQGGTARIALGFESGFSVGGNLTLDASGFGTPGTTIGRGGTAELLIPVASVTVNGATNLFANGTGGASGTTGGDGIGGIARVAITGGTVNLQQLNIVANGQGNGGVATNSFVTNAGNGLGGTAELSIGSGTVDITDVAILASGAGGENDTSLPGGAGGNGTGGNARFLTSGGSSTFSSLTLEAVGSGGFGTAAGGSGAGGNILVQASGGATTTADFLTLLTDAQNGAAEPGGVDGGVDSSASNAQIIADGAGTALTINTSLNISADAAGTTRGATGGDIIAGNIRIEARNEAALTLGSGGNDVSADARGSIFGLSDRPGATRGGTIVIGAARGTLSTTSSLFTSANAISAPGLLSGGAATGGSITLFASGDAAVQGLFSVGSFVDAIAVAEAGQGQAGSNGTGGTILAYAQDGTLSIGNDVTFDTSGVAGFNTTGATPGTGRGGSITIETRATANNLSAINFLNLDVFSRGDGVPDFEGLPPPSVGGGTGMGGSIAFNLMGGTFATGALSVEAVGTGGVATPRAGGSPAYAAGDGRGGSAILTIGGAAATIDTIDINAGGFGGLAPATNSSASVAGIAGNGFGGTARIDALSGSLSGTSINVFAHGAGGNGAASAGGASSVGGNGTGGNASINLNGPATIIAADLTVDAGGFGGLGGASFFGAAASSGGTGTGGTAAISIASGALNVPIAVVRARGTGGGGGETFDGGDASNGGAGVGGNANFTKTGGLFQIDDLSLSASGIGGLGGVSRGASNPPGRGGDGGNGTGGGANLAISSDPVIPLLAIDVDGLGGNGGAGAVGGNGGSGQGGVNVGGVGGANLIATSTVLDIGSATVSSRGTGGVGGTGLSGMGGTGGSGTGGDALARATGAGANLHIDSASILAGGTGGAGGQGGIDSASNGATGGAGGIGRGGNALATADTNAILSFGPGALIRADGLGGSGGVGGSFGLVGGNGGVGGAGFGGAAGIRISGATLEISGSPTAYTIAANGTGGSGATGATGMNTGGIGGNGGDGTGGGTLFEILGAAVATGLVALDSQGFGGASGDGGFASSGAASAGGNNGNGFGGTAALTNTDSGGAAFGTIALGDVTLNANGNAGLGGGTAGTASYGRVDIKDNATAPGGSLSANSIVAVSLGTAVTPGLTGGIFVESAGDPLAVVNNVSLNTNGAIGFAFSGNGSLVAGGTLSAIADGNITVTHAGQPGTPVDSIVANGIIFDTRANFSADAASRIRSSSTLDIDALGNIAAGNLFAVNRITAGALGNITLGNAAVTGAVSPPFGGPPTNGVIELRAGLDPKVSSGTFQPADITITGNVAATGHVLAEAGNDIIVGTGASVVSDNRITFRSGDDILVRTGAVVRAANNPLPEFGYGVTGPLDEPALLAFNAGAISVSPTIPGNVASIIVDGTIGAPARAVTLTGGAIQADANAITAKHLYANIAGAPAAGTPANNDGGQLRADCVQGNICLGTLTVTDTVAIGPSSGSVGLPNRVAIAGNVNALDVSIRARDAISFGTAGAPATVNGTNRLAIAALTGDLTLNGASVLSGNGPVTIYAGGSIIAPAATIRSTGNLGIFASGNVALGTLDAGGLLQTVDSDGIVTQANGFSTSGSVTIADLLAVRGGAFTLAAATGVDIGRLIASGGDARLDSSGGAIIVRNDLTTSGAFRAFGRSIALTAQGNLILTDAIASAGDLSLTSVNGDLSLAGADASGALRLSAFGRADINGLAVGQTIRVRSADIGIGATGQLGSIGRTTQVDLLNGDASRRSFIGGTDQSGAYSLSAAEIARIYSDNIGLQLPMVGGQAPLSIGSSRQPDIVIGPFTLSSRAGNSAGNLGANGIFRIQTTGKVRVVGAVSLTGLGAGNRFELQTGEALEIDAASGSIDMRDAGGGLAGTLYLGADDFIAASLSAISDVAAATSIGAINDRLGTNDGAAIDDGYLRAGGIEVNARNSFYVQNSGASSDTADRRGFTVGAGGLSIATGSPSARIVINGRQANSTGGFITGLDMIPQVQINGQAGAAVNTIDRLSTVNGCLIASPAFCTTSLQPATPLSRDIFENAIDPVDEEAALNQLFPLTLIELKDFEPMGFEPLIDEPVTGAGNDDLWMPECDPATEQCEAPPER